MQFTDSVKVRAKEEIHRNLKNIKYEAFSGFSFESSDSTFPYWNKPFSLNFEN